MSDLMSNHCSLNNRSANKLNYIRENKQKVIKTGKIEL